MRDSWDGAVLSLDCDGGSHKSTDVKKTAQNTHTQKSASTTGEVSSGEWTVLMSINILL